MLEAGARHTSMGGVAVLTGQGLRSLLHAQLSRLGVPVPNNAECEKLVLWAGYGPVGGRGPDFPVFISEKPHQKLVAFRNSLDEAENYWRSLGGDSDLGDQLLQPFARLRSALAECEPLVMKLPSDFNESWEATATSLAMVFHWIVNRSGSNIHSGLSIGGPSMTFVYEGLKELGWVSGTTPSDGAVLQFLKRHRSKRDI